MLKRPDNALTPIQGRSVRFRLLAIALLPMLVILPLLLGVAIIRWNEKFNAALISKVNGDLTIAHQYLARILEYTSEHLQALGLSARFRDVVATKDNAELDALLEDRRKALGLDFLYVANGDGSLVASAPKIALPSIRSDWPVVAAALKGSPSIAIDIFANDELRDIARGLAERAQARTGADAERGPDRPRRGNPRHGGSFRKPGLARRRPASGARRRHAAEPESRLHRYYQRPRLSRGQPAGGKSGNCDAVPRRRADHHQCAPVRGSAGARHAGVERGAIDVLDQGRTWLDSAFVVNDWYISGL